MKKLVIENGADIGFAFDGDADRCLAVDENGELIYGDKILAICGLYLKEKGRLPGETVVGTVMSNMGLSVMGNKHGINIEQAGVGDRYVIEKMLEGGYALGGEQSGHIIFHDYNTCLLYTSIAFNLKKEGYNVITAGDGEEAVAVADEKNPDLILLDIMMPKMDGYEACRKIRQKHNMPIIMLTARAEELDKEMCIRDRRNT